MADVPESIDGARAALELAKLRVEIKKLAREASWRATIIPSLVSLAAVAFSASQFWTTRQNDLHESASKDQALQIACIDAGTKVTQLLWDKWDAFGKASGAEQLQYANTLLAAFPPSTAKQSLKALATRVNPTDPAVQDALIRGMYLADKMVEQSGDAGFPCKPVNDLPQIATAEVAADSAAPTAAVAPSPGDTTPQPQVLNTFYHVTRPIDRVIAGKIADAIAAADAEANANMKFPKAGVEWVRTADLGDTQIRYYKHDQEEAAVDLAKNIRVVAAAMSLSLDVAPVYIGGIFPNLPEGRIEVWLQPLTRKSVAH